MPKQSRAILITGASSGIGRATAIRLAQRGLNVYASARNVSSIESLGEYGCKTLSLDVTDSASIENAVREVSSREGAVGVLINNAGYSQTGAIESVPMAQARRQFETNFFGAVELIQQVLPGMRAQRWGKIVNISSMGGEFTFPGAGFYHATKHALEAVSDALRFEVEDFGIDVIIIQPGIIRTNYPEAAAETLHEIDDTDDPYAEFNREVARLTRETYEDGPLARMGGDPAA
ncbi:MAG: SDR family NAD(P)-dependent oxidoreductase, partial [Chloroflexota bacterium]